MLPGLHIFTGVEIYQPWYQTIAKNAATRTPIHAGQYEACAVGSSDIILAQAMMVASKSERMNRRIDTANSMTVFRCRDRTNDDHRRNQPDQQQTVDAASKAKGPACAGPSGWFLLPSPPNSFEASLATRR